MLPVAILAGGLATRLHPITEKIPKALVPVGGKPFIEWQLAALRDFGFRDIVLCVGFLGEMIEAQLGHGERFGLKLSYSYDGHKLKGTGGALRQALPLLSERFLILYGDSYLPIDFRAVNQVFIANGKKGIMTILKNNDQWDRSNVEYANGEITEYNKKEPNPNMSYIDYGLGGVTSKMLEKIPQDDVFDIADVYHELSVAGELGAFEVHDRFYEIGSHQGLKETEIYLTSRREK
jgi:MurNAc alpha-1-phosphate uridylyltransferase